MTKEQRRELDLDKLVLASGSHKSPKDGFCVMEAVAFVAGEPHSDNPQCASRVIGAFLRRWNDDLDDAGRQMLRPYILRLVGTRASAEIEQRRGWLAADWMIRQCTPAWLDLAGLTEQAAALRALPEIISPQTLNGAKRSIYAARSKVDDSGAAAWAAAWAGAGDAAWDASGAAAWVAAWAGAGDAAWAAAGDAAWAAAGDAKDLKPTKLALQNSALVLLDKMIALSPGAP
jgi:hypothetical protein